MTKRELGDSELEHLFDSDEESVSEFSENSVNDEDCASGYNSSSSCSAESIVITPIISPDILDSSVSSAWNPVTGSRNTFTKTFKTSGVNEDIASKLTETNRYARQKMKKRQPKIKPWSDTDNVEMRKFFGIILWMGLLRLPKIRNYWSKNVLYENNISKFMCRNRFEQLSSNIHFCDNMQTDENDQPYKISDLLEMINKKFQHAYIPGEEICIGESNAPFHGRMYFGRDISNKRIKHGIKFFKLCTAGGYTWKYKVYAGKEKENGGCVGEKVVMELTNGLLDSGRTVYTDSWCTSISLAKTLIDRDTHLVGTLRFNRGNIPEEVIQKKLKKGEIISRQNEDKIVVLKWKGKRDVLMLSTKHDDSIIGLSNKGKAISKPVIVTDYKKGKAYIRLSDQMEAYLSCARRTTKWYKRLVFHLMTATTVVNAHYLYKTINGKNIELTNFRELLVQALTTTDSIERPVVTSTEHILKEVEGQKRYTRKRCSVCYKTLSVSKGYEYASRKAKKVNTICEKCNIPICLVCFQKNHSNVL